MEIGRKANSAASDFINPGWPHDPQEVLNGWQRLKAQ